MEKLRTGAGAAVPTGAAVALGRAGLAVRRTVSREVVWSVAGNYCRSRKNFFGVLLGRVVV